MIVGAHCSAHTIRPSRISAHGNAAPGVYTDSRNHSAANFSATHAAAQDAPKPARGVISIREVVIVGRVQKPVASVDVNKIQPKLTLGELKQPFLDRIEEAVAKDPF